MKRKVKNYTFSLPIEIVDRMREYANEKYIPSVNAGVRKAIEEYTRKLEKEKLNKELRKASKDPLFLRDIDECTNDFDALDAETGRGRDRW